MNSASAATLMRLGSSGSERSLGGTTSSPSRTEEERLKKELQHWKLDLDGVLGSVGGSSPGSTRGVSAASTPRVELPSFTPLEAAFMGRSTSTPPRRPTWADDWSGSGSKDEPKVTQRSASLPTSSLSPLPPIPTNESPDQSPEIRLVDGAGVGDNSPVEMLASPAMESAEADQTESSSSFSATTALPPPVPSVAAPSAVDTSSVDSGLGLGLGLPTITESSHSRDSSLATPTKDTLEMTPRRPSTADGATIPPFVLTESPSTPAPPAAHLSNQRNKAARQSVVTYPSSSSVARSSLPGSKNASSTSLNSDPQRRADGQAVGETLEEQAKDAAQRCWDEDGSFLVPKKIAEWLGSP